MSSELPLQPEAGPSTTSSSPYIIGNRYLNSKTLHPLTLRYVGPLPPLPTSSSTSGPVHVDGSVSSSSHEQIWLGVEYDDPRNGKGHNGLYKGIQVFKTLEEGSGSFLKYTPGSEPLKGGNSLIESIEERYGRIIPFIIPLSEDGSNSTNGAQDNNEQRTENEKIILGSSENSIIVQAPNLLSVKERVSKLERIRNMGFEEEYIGSLGGDEGIIGVLRERMKGLKWLNLSKNLLSTWDQVWDIVNCFDGLEILTLNHSRLQPIPFDQSTDSREKLISTFERIRELHLSDCLLLWDEVCKIIPLFPNLEILHLEGNRRLTELTRPPDGLEALKELRLSGCPLKKWEEIVSCLSGLTRLESLDLSFTLIDNIPPVSHPQAKFNTLVSLTLLESTLRSWSDLDNLSTCLPNLTKLRFTLQTTNAQASVNDQLDNQLKGVDEKSLRSIYISKFPNLIMFNSNPISSTERKDSELFYISFVKKWISRDGSNKDNWGRFEELCRVHGVKEIPGDESGKKMKGGLKGRMINLYIHTSLNPSETTEELKEISILPTAKISLLQRKLTRLFGVPTTEYQNIQIWNTKYIPSPDNRDMNKDEDGRGRVEMELEKVNKVTNIWEDKQVGWWFNDGDEIFVEFFNERED